MVAVIVITILVTVGLMATILAIARVITNWIINKRY
jgi:hypothetical protein